MISTSVLDATSYISIKYKMYNINLTIIYDIFSLLKLNWTTVKYPVTSICKSVCQGMTYGWTSQSCVICVNYATYLLVGASKVMDGNA